MFGIGMTELMVIFVIGLVILGPKRLPELARSLGRSLAEFRRASNDLRREFLDVTEEAKIAPPHLDAESRSEGGDPAASRAGGDGAGAEGASAAETPSGQSGEPARDG